MNVDSKTKSMRWGLLVQLTVLVLCGLVSHSVAAKAPASQKRKTSISLAKLIQQTQDRKQAMRVIAMQKLANYHGKEPALLIALSHRLLDANQLVRVLAAKQLVRWGTSVLSVIRPALGHSDKKIRWTAAYTVSLLPKTQSIRSVLILLLRDSYYRVRTHGIRGLTKSNISDTEWEAIRDLLKRELHPINRMRCLDALMLKKKKVLAILAHHMHKDAHPLVRRYAARLIARGGFPAKQVNQIFYQGLQKEQDDVIKLAFLRMWGRLVLQRRAGYSMLSTRPLIPILLKSHLWTLREATILHIGSLGKAAKPFIPLLKKRQKDAYPAVRKAANRILKQLTQNPTSKRSK